MIKHLTLLGTALLFSSQILLAQWKPAGDKIRTFWAEKVDVNNVLPEYLCYVVRYMHLEKYFSGATIPHIYFRDYKNEVFNSSFVPL